MEAEQRDDLLFCVLLGEGVINLVAAYALILVITRSAHPHQIGGPAIVFAATALLLILTSAIAGLTQRSPTGVRQRHRQDS